MENKTIKSTYFGKRSKFTSVFDMHRGMSNDFINIRVMLKDANKGKTFLDEDYISNYTFAIKDVELIIKGLQAMVKHQKGRK